MFTKKGTPILTNIFHKRVKKVSASWLRSINLSGLPALRGIWPSPPNPTYRNVPLLVQLLGIMLFLLFLNNTFSSAFLTAISAREPQASGTEKVRTLKYFPLGLSRIQPELQEENKYLQRGYR